MIGYTPAGLVLATPKSIQLAAEEAILLCSGQQIEVSAQQEVRCLAAENISFFAENGHINFIAAKADILFQAPDKAVQITAGSGITIGSESGRVAVSAKEELLLSCGGAYIRLKDGNITLSCPGDIIVQSQTWQKQGPSSLSVDYNHSNFSTEFNDEYIICHSATGEPLKQTRVKVIRSDGTELYYTTNDEGKIPMQKNDSREKLTIYVLGAAAGDEESATNTTHVKK